MKRKLIMLSLSLAVTATIATAQTKDKYFSEKAKDNIFISVGVGGQLSLNSDNFDNSFGKAITPHVTLSLGKWIDPVWGFRGQLAGWSQKLRTDRNSGTWAGDAVTGFGNVASKKINYIALHADGLMNLSNLLAGYNPDRVFNLSLFAGPGLTLAKERSDETIVPDKASGTWVRSVDSGDVTPIINGSVGLLAGFQVSKYLDINLEARGEVSPSVFGKYSNNSYTDGAVSLIAGVTYTFGGKNFVTCPKVDESAINDEVNRYRRELSEAQAELAKAQNALANAKPVTTEVVKEVTIAGPRAVFFEIGRSKISDRGMVNLEMAAKIIKANPGKKYKIAGYADKATGSAKLNQTLSEKRAQVVYDALIKEGVAAEQLELVGFGGTDNMFSKDALNRVVILE